MRTILRVTIEPLQETIELLPGESLRDALLRHGINIEGPCNGQGICGQCGVVIEAPGDVPETPHERISSDKSGQGWRLSCRVVPRGNMTIRLPADFTRDAKRIREAQRILEGERISWGRVASAVHVFQEGGSWMLRYDRQKETAVLGGWRESFVPKGLAVDLGTTTMVVTLVSLRTGEELATASMLNPQIRLGHDVITRIRHAASPSGLRQLRDMVRHGLNILIQEACEDSESDPDEILDAVIGGNTTMLELAAGIDPSPLGRLPFRVDIRGSASHSASLFGLRINPRARAYVPPIIHAFIGTDVTAGLLMSGEFFDDSRTVLYIDVGTNGELAVNNRGSKFASSAAAGPAFEGSSLSCGMRASVGAVSTVATDGYDIELTVIGDTPAKGICGSGIVDLIACLLELGIVDRTGRMKAPSEVSRVSPAVRDRLEEVDGRPAFRLGDGVFFTQQAVREIQLSKAAIRSTIDILLAQANLEAADLCTIVIAGGFGFSLNPVSLERIGLIPPGTGGRVSFAGNASRRGCVWLLNDITYRRYLESRVSEIGHLSTAGHPQFMERYIASMEFP
jgi:uncharacterized 2Fe-2S/4Fe-4S cluster protein (DUF4445 family)